MTRRMPAMQRTIARMASDRPSRKRPGIIRGQLGDVIDALLKAAEIDSVEQECSKAAAKRSG